MNEIVGVRKWVGGKTLFLLHGLVLYGITSLICSKWIMN